MTLEDVIIYLIRKEVQQRTWSEGSVQPCRSQRRSQPHLATSSHHIQNNIMLTLTQEERMQYSYLGACLPCESCVARRGLQGWKNS